MKTDKITKDKLITIRIEKAKMDEIKKLAEKEKLSLSKYMIKKSME